MPKGTPNKISEERFREASRMVLAALATITGKFEFGRFFRPAEIVFSIPPREEKNRPERKLGAVFPDFIDPKVKRGPPRVPINEENVYSLLKPYIERGLVFTRGKKSCVFGAVDNRTYRANDSMPGAIAEEVGREMLERFMRYSGLKV